MSQRKAHKLEDKERTDDIHIEENVDFASMHLSERVLKGLNKAGFERPSPIQLAAIPLGRCGLDLVVQAKSGTGKTCVFTVIALEMISVSASTTQVLVVAPTREIAVQITQVISAVGSGMPELRSCTFIGGIPLGQDKAKLHCCHIAVGTPGRITQLVELGLLKLDNVRLLVLDEADQLLTGQFTEGVVQLASALPLNKQILALSATYTDEVAKVAEGLMRSPNHVRLGRNSPALLGVNQFVRLLPYHHQPHRWQKTKFEELLVILAKVTFNQCLVFSNSQLRAESVCNALRTNGWPVSYLSGGQKQSDRLQALEELCSYKCRVLVSTDLSARGLDSEHVNLVVNLDMPYNQATYLHRVGRAGRFGSRGGAITLVTEGEEWQAMRAVATLANVRIHLLPSDFEASIASKEIQGLEEVEKLTDMDAQAWLEKTTSQNYDRKTKDKAKEVPEQEDTTHENSRRSREEVSCGGKIMTTDDASKENSEINTASRKQYCKSRAAREQIDKNANRENKSDSKTKSRKMNRQEDTERLNREDLSMQKETERKRKEEKLELQAEQYQKVLTLLEGLKVHQSTKTVSYLEILNQCLEKYDNISATDNPKVKASPFPVQLTPIEADLKAMDDHWRSVQKDLLDRISAAGETWRDDEGRMYEALEALIEGNEALTVLKKSNQSEAVCSAENHFATQLTQENSSHCGDECNGDSSATSELAVCDQDAYTQISVKQRAPTKIQKSCLDIGVPQLSSDEFTDKYPNKCKLQEKKIPKADDVTQTGHAKHWNEKQTEIYNDCYPAKLTSRKVLNTKKQMKKTMKYGNYYTKGYYDDGNQRKWEYGTQPLSNYQHPMHNTDHCLRQQYNNANNCQQESTCCYPDTKQVGAQRDHYDSYHRCETCRTHQHHEENNCYNISSTYWNPYNASAYWSQMSYVEDACKFASMMDYVQTMGKMSAWMAQNICAHNKDSNV